MVVGERLWIEEVVSIVLALLLPPCLQCVYHLLLHHVYVALLVFERNVGRLDHFFHELELLLVQVALFRLMLKILLFPYGSLFASLALHLSIFLLFLGIFDSLTITSFAGSFSLEHIIDHILQIARLGLLLDFCPVLHDRVFELDTQLVLPQGFQVILIVMLHIIVEDVVERKRVI